MNDPLNIPIDVVNSDTFIIKLNFSEGDITHTNIPFQFDSSDELVFMNKLQYYHFILQQSGSFISHINVDHNCSICHSRLKYTHKLYKLNRCNHLFHSKCIKKWFKTKSEQFNSLHDCPLCRISYEQFI